MKKKDKRELEYLRWKARLRRRLPGILTDYEEEALDRLENEEELERQRIQLIDWRKNDTNNRG